MMNKLKDISTYRTPMMGLSIIWVILYHIGLEYDFANPMIGKITSLGYGGVDFFLFLSGFGLYYSYLKDNNLKSFYRKRFRRILPEFILVTILFGLVDTNSSIVDVLMKITTIGYWLPLLKIPHHLWYVSAIILFYLLFPLYMYFFNKKPKLSLVTGCIIGLVLTLIYSYTFLVLYPHEKNGLIFFTSRIPLFCIGVYFGKLSLFAKVQKQLIVTIVWMSILFIVVLFLMTKYIDYWILRNGGLFYYPFIFIVPGACLIISCILKKTPSMASFLSFFGKISFELYLVHEGLILYLGRFMSNMEIPVYITTMFIFVISVIFAYIVYLINKMFLNKHA